MENQVAKYELRLLRLPAVMDCTSMCRSQIYHLEACGKFPRRVSLAGRSVAWRESEISEWIQARERKVRS